MKKIALILLIGIVITSSFSTANILNEQKTILTIQDNFDFFEKPLMQSNNNYIEIELEGTNAFTVEEDFPRLPIFIKTFELPKNVKINNVNCFFSDIIEEVISNKIIPVSKAIPLSYDYNVNDFDLIEENIQIYESENIFPEKTFDYTIRCGLNEKGIQTTFVSIITYPIRYIPNENKIYHAQNLDIHLSYEKVEDETKTSSLESTDMIIIAPNEFSSEIQKLVTHKNNMGLNTIFKSTEDIYSEFSGVDKPEQIKYFIKDAKETLNISYILLVGGLKSMFFAKDKDDCNQGSSDWYVPVRYTNIRGQNADPYGTLSDLYFSDLYRYNEDLGEWEFEDWDSDGNGIFAEHSWFSRDTLDMVPDIYVGRLACRSIDEVKIVVNKIINYESSSPSEKPWFRTMVGIGGRTFRNENGQPDGEVVCDVAFNLMDDLIDDEVKVYASNNITGGPVPITEDIVKAISDGAGYVVFEGHGSPMKWNTNWAEGGDHNWIGGITLHNFLNIKNEEKLPIVIIGGCHNGMFNISVIPALLAHYIDKDEERYWSSGYPTPECMSWRLLAKPDGGAIASTGCTGYGFGGDGAVTRSSELEVDFFYMIGNQSVENLGNAHAASISKFISENSIKKIEMHCIAVYQLFGDPSLKLGGYE
ncbi:MAG: hypothetical protein DRN27_01365 [Thermoplasmata archaeon]|nr:MAG: hypothetical protein DRN27_01365 [Thermoplasmata archaeon]